MFVLNIERPALDADLREFRLHGFQQLPVGSGPSAVQQSGLRQQHRTAANGDYAAGMGRQGATSQPPPSPPAGFDLCR